MSNLPPAYRAAFTTLSAHLKDYSIIILGIVLYAVGFTVFILPHNIVIGGMAGFSSLIYYASGERIPVAVTMYVANILLLLGGFRVLGRTFLVRTIFGMTMLSLAIGMLEGYFTTHVPLVQSAAMSVGIGAVLCGFGIGLYYSHGGTCGGTDIVAAILSRKSHFSMGRVMMVVDFTIVALSIFLPFDGDLEARMLARAQTIILGWLCIFVYSYIADRYVGFDVQTVQFIILSDRWEQIAYRITHETGRGATVWDATGYWTGTPRKMVMVWCRERDSYKIYSICKQCDDHAYVTSSYVRNVFGNGFDILTPRKPTRL